MKTIIALLCFSMPCILAPIHKASRPHTSKKTRPATAPIKDWSFLLYIAGNNDLHKFAAQNLIELQTIGSNKRINILAQLDTFGEKEISRFFIKNNLQECIEKKKNTKECISGTPESLFSFVKWATKHFPSKHLALVLWNHGSGIKDPAVWGKLLPSHRSKLFEHNTQTGMYEVNRNIVAPSTMLRGIAFNDTFETYLTNAELKNTLQKISTSLLGGKKIDILGMDACHMAMVEVCAQVKNSTHYLVASQEVEPGDGWNYQLTIEPFQNHSLTPQAFAHHIVSAYGKQYNEVFADLTLSAIDLKKITPLEQHINNIADKLQTLCDKQANQAPLRKIIRRTRKSAFATYTFLDGDYIDLHHFCKSLRKKIKNSPKYSDLRQQLKTITRDIETCVVANTTGQSIPQVKGLSIYFPQKHVHKSYPYSDFGATNKWTNFLYKFTKQPKIIRSL